MTNATDQDRGESNFDNFCKSVCNKMLSIPNLCSNLIHPSILGRMFGLFAYANIYAFINNRLMYAELGIFFKCNLFHLSSVIFYVV